MKAKFTARQCRQLAHAFRLARAQIQRAQQRDMDSQQFICLVLDGLARDGRITEATALTAQDEVIMNRLAPSSSLGRWLQVRGYVDANFSYRREMAETRKAINKHRIAWLDLLIKEFSELAEVAP